MDLELSYTSIWLTDSRNYLALFWKNQKNHFNEHSSFELQIYRRTQLKRRRERVRLELEIRNNWKLRRRLASLEANGNPHEIISNSEPFIVGLAWWNRSKESLEMEEIGHIGQALLSFPTRSSCMFSHLNVPTKDVDLLYSYRQEAASESNSNRSYSWVDFLNLPIHPHLCLAAIILCLSPFPRLSIPSQPWMLNLAQSERGSCVYCCSP